MLVAAVAGVLWVPGVPSHAAATTTASIDTLQSVNGRPMHYHAVASGTSESRLHTVSASCEAAVEATSADADTLTSASCYIHDALTATDHALDHSLVSSGYSAGSETGTVILPPQGAYFLCMQARIQAYDAPAVTGPSVCTPFRGIDIEAPNIQRLVPAPVSSADLPSVPGTAVLHSRESIGASAGRYVGAAQQMHSVAGRPQSYLLACSLAHETISTGSASVRCWLRDVESGAVASGDAATSAGGIAFARKAAVATVPAGRAYDFCMQGSITAGGTTSDGPVRCARVSA